MAASTRKGPRALVLDGQYCHALAAVRSLGQRGYVVHVASHKPRAQGFASRWCAAAFTAPDPNREPVPYLAWLQEQVRAQAYAAVLFFEEATADIVSENLAALQEHAGIALPGREAFQTAARKDRSSRLARELGLHVPRSTYLTSMEDLAELQDTWRFPVVVKGVASSGSQQVTLARDPGELGDQVRRIAALQRDASLPLPMVQEFIPGRGYGLTALYREGEPVAAFMHRRIAEHDIARGSGLAHGATGAESVDEPALLDAGQRLLGALRWHGIAMVEFKRDTRDGTFWFIEINPRFVGSLELAIAAGVDLPVLYAQLAEGRPVVGPNRYVERLRYRWLLSKNVADAFENPLGYARAWLEALRPDTRTDLCWRDPAPHLRHLRNAAWWVREHLGRGRRARAQGAGDGRATARSSAAGEPAVSEAACPSPHDAHDASSDPSQPTTP